MFIKKSSLRQLFLMGVLFTVVIAIAGIWFIRQPVLKETDVFVPIESENASKSVVVISPRPAGLDVRLRGTAEALSGLSQKSLRYPLGGTDFRNGEERKGVRIIAVDAKKMELPANLAIVHIHPPKITARIEPLIEKALTVEAVFTGSPAANFAVENTAIHPDKVLVSGPESIVSTLMRIRIKPVDINGIAKSFRKRVLLDLPDEVKPIEETSVFAEVTVRKKSIVKRLDGIVIKGQGAKISYQISPPTIELIVKGPAQAISSLKSNPDFAVYVDLANLQEGMYVRRAVIVLPLDMTLVKATPELFTIHMGSVGKEEG